MESKKSEVKSVVFIRIDRGDEVVSSILEACETHGIQSGIVAGIGALGQATVASGLSTESKEPKPLEFRGPLEICSALGNISRKDGKPVLHLHVTLGLDDHTTVGGHLLEGVVSLTGEFAVMETGAEIGRQFDKKLNMDVWGL